MAIINVDAEKLNQTINQKKRPNKTHQMGAMRKVVLVLGSFVGRSPSTVKNIILYLWNKEITSENDDPLEYFGNSVQMVFVVVI